MERARVWWTRSVVALAALVLASGATPGAAGATASDDDCVERVLVLTAMPLELHPLLDAATIDPADTVRLEERTYYVGQLADEDVVLAMTGIGMVNAEQAVDAAFEHFSCGLSAVVFSGVAGSKRAIGDVAVPERWTLDGGETWLAADPGMVGTARDLIGRVELSKSVPVGDDACLCPGVDTIDTPVQVEHDPQLWVGGDGTTSDSFGGRALPCVPGGGDVFGCQACLAPGSTAADAADFAANVPDYASPEFLSDFLQPPDETTDTYESQDMESGAAAAAAQRHGVPFVAVRGVSDGQGDPLHLPGFPFQFFAYRHLAADNAAAVTIALLEAWSPEGVTTPPDVPAARDAPDTPDAADPQASGAPAGEATPAADPAALPATGGGSALVLLGAVGIVLALTLARSRRAATRAE